jgi:hypothetical protein
MNENDLDQLLKADLSPHFYRQYASMFQRYVDTKDKRIFRTLDRAGHCLFQMVMHIDRQEDDQENNMGVSLDLHLESILLLNEVFGPGHSFWQDFRRAQTLFSRRHHFEKRCVRFPSYDHYRQLAISRASLASVALDALSHLAKDKNHWHLLRQSHDKFVEAFQLYDDCSDFKEDFEKNQFNWANHRYTAQYTQVPDAAHFFRSTLFNELMLEVIDLLRAAQHLIKPLGNSHYAEMLGEFKSSVRRTLAN